MRILEILELDADSPELCRVEQVPGEASLWMYKGSKPRPKDYLVVDAAKKATARIRYRFQGGIVEAYVDQRTLEYLIDCAQPVKEQYAKQIAILKAARKRHV